MNDNSSGFSQQTSIVLEGLGAGNLIPEIKKRNISTNALFELSQEDFVTLGADKNLAETIIKRLKIRSDAKKAKLNKSEQEFANYIDILKNGKQQLSSIKSYLTYTKHKLNERQNDFIVDFEHNIRASEALQEAATTAVKELCELESQFKQVSALLFENNNKKDFKLNHLVNGMGVGLSLLLAWKCYHLLKN